MKIQLIFNKIFSIGVLCLVLLLTPSCYKKKNTIAIITVLDSSNESPVNGATVRLFYEDPTGANATELDVQDQTGNDGTVAFDFSDNYKDGQAGFAVLDIEVNGAFEGVVQIKEMEKTEKTVYL